MKLLSFDGYIKSFQAFGEYSEEYGYQLEHLLQLAKHHLTDGFSILDIGAGTGFFARDFLNESKKTASSYTAIEPSEKHVESIKENLKGMPLEIKIRNELFTPQKSLNQKFDLIIMSHCLYWFMPDPEPYILNAIKLLETGGMVVMYLQTPFTASHILNLLFDKQLPVNRAPNHRINSWTIMDILERNEISYDVSNLPGTFQANILFENENNSILNDLLSFFLSVEAESLPDKIKKRAVDALKMISYKEGDEVKLNLEVGAITVN